MNIKQSKFYRPKPLKEKVVDTIKGLLFWRGRKKGMIYTRDITLDDIRAVFFPENFYEKYKYLGSVPYRELGTVFKAMYPLVLAMDYEAKPKGCPRWFLRFLHLFGSDNSIIRVRNLTLHNLKVKLTKGIMMNDYKTKWTDYDLRISISAPEHLHNLANAIEGEYFSQGRQKELAEQIKELDPNASIIWGNVNRLVKQYNDLKDKTNEDVYDYIS
jgi:hypothetical protein